MNLKLRKMAKKLFSGKRSERTGKKSENFFNLPAVERIRILKAAGREAQKYQLDLIKEYETRFGQTG